MDIDDFRTDPLNRIAADMVRPIREAGMCVAEGIEALHRAFAMALASGGHGDDSASLEQELMRTTVPEIVRLAREYRAMGMGEKARGEKDVLQ